MNGAPVCGLAPTINLESVMHRKPWRDPRPDKVARLLAHLEGEGALAPTVDLIPAGYRARVAYAWGVSHVPPPRAPEDEEKNLYCPDCDGALTGSGRCPNDCGWKGEP